MATASREPTLEALSVVVQPPPGREALSVAKQVARRVKIQGWRIEPVLADGTEVELVPPTTRLSAARAWDITYALRDQPEVVHAAPLFRYLVPENAEPRGRRAAGGQATDDPATATEYDWSLRKANVLEAWRLFGPKLPGSASRSVTRTPATRFTLSSRTRPASSSAPVSTMTTMTPIPLTI